MLKLIKSFSKLSLIFFVSMAVFTGCSSDKDVASDKNIIFGVTPWTSTIPPTKVAELILQDMGYTVEEISADAGSVFAGLSQGDIDVFMDSWLPDMHKNYMDKFGDSIDDISISYPNGELGLVIPSYIDGIDTVEDLRGKEEIFGGKIYGIEEGAGITVTTRELIESYGLDFEYVASSEGAMLAQSSKLMQNKEPVIFVGWRPHTMFVNYDLKVLEDTQGFFKTSEVHVLANESVKEKYPDAYKFLSNWSIDVADVEKMIFEIESGRTPEEVAQEWIDNNQDKVNKMLEE